MNKVKYFVFAFTALSFVFGGYSCDDAAEVVDSNPIDTIPTDTIPTDTVPTDTVPTADLGIDLFISEYGEGWGSNKFLEIYNPTASSVNLSGYKIIRYSNGGMTEETAYTVVLPDFDLEPFKVYVITQDKRVSAGTDEGSPIWDDLEARADLFVNSTYDDAIDGSKCVQWSGDDAVVLAKVTDGAIVDIFGTVGVRPSEAATVDGNSYKAWTDTPDYDNGNGIALTVDHSLVRRSEVKDGVTLNPDHFNVLAEYDTLSANVFTSLGWHEFDGAPANSLPVVTMDSLYTISALAEEGDVVVSISATDADVDQSLEYYLVSGNYVYIGDGDDAVRHTPFALDQATGIFTVSDEEALAEATDAIPMVVVACDEYGQSEEITFKILIAD